MKKRNILYFSLAVVFSLSLFGCGKDIQQTLEEGSEKADKISFPTSFKEDIENISFDMDVVVDADLIKEPAIVGKASIQKLNREKAYEMFFQDIGEYDTYEDKTENEYGENVQTIDYVNAEKAVLSYGKYSSTFYYMQFDLLPYIRSAFRIDLEDEQYNADLFSQEEQLSFMSREDAVQKVKDTLKELDLKLDTDATAYAMNYVTLQEQEYHADMYGGISREEYKEQWTDADDSYYIYMAQTYKDVPLYHKYHDIFTEVSDENAPIQALVSKDGIEYLDVEYVFEITEETGKADLVPFDVIVERVSDKYNQILGDSTYKMNRAELYYYVDMSSGKGVYDVRPVWIFQGEESGDENRAIQVIIDAQTAKEIIP